MPPFPVTTHEKHLVFNIVVTLEVKIGDLAIEPLPLGQLLLKIALTVGIIGSIDEAEINSSLVFVSLCSHMCLTKVIVILRN